MKELLETLMELDAAVKRQGLIEDRIDLRNDYRN